MTALDPATLQAFDETQRTMSAFFACLGNNRKALEEIRDALTDEFVAKVRGINCETKTALYRAMQIQIVLTSLEQAEAALLNQAEAALLVLKEALEVRQ